MGCPLGVSGGQGVTCISVSKRTTKAFPVRPVPPRSWQEAGQGCPTVLPPLPNSLTFPHRLPGTALNLDSSLRLGLLRNSEGEALGSISQMCSFLTQLTESYNCKSLFKMKERPAEFCPQCLQQECGHECGHSHAAGSWGRWVREAGVLGHRAEGCLACGV